MKHIIYFIASVITGAFIVWLSIYTVHLVFYDPDALWVIFGLFPLMIAGVLYVKKKVFEYLAEEWWDNGN